MSTVSTQCPVDDCFFGPSSLDALGVHIRRMHQQYSGEARANVHATAPETRKCPICKTLVALDDYLAHTSGHAAHELHAARSSPAYESVVVRSIAGDASRQLPSSVVIHVDCPICHIPTPNLEQFRHHLLTNHILFDSTDALSHFHAWKDLLKQHAT